MVRDNKKKNRMSTTACGQIHHLFQRTKNENIEQGEKIDDTQPRKLHTCMNLEMREVR